MGIRWRVDVVNTFGRTLSQRWFDDIGLAREYAQLHPDRGDGTRAIPWTVKSTGDEDAIEVGLHER